MDEYRVAEAQIHGTAIIAAIEGVATREAAHALRGFVAGVPRAALPKAAPDEHYWSDLVGLVVVNRAGRTLGAWPDCWTPERIRYCGSTARAASA